MSDGNILGLSHIPPATSQSYLDRQVPGLGHPHTTTVLLDLRQVDKTLNKIPENVEPEASATRHHGAGMEVNLPGVAYAGRSVAWGRGSGGGNAAAGGGRIGRGRAVAADACEGACHAAAATCRVAARPRGHAPVRLAACSCRAAARQLFACRAMHNVIMNPSSRTRVTLELHVTMQQRSSLPAAAAATLPDSSLSAV